MCVKEKHTYLPGHNHPCRGVSNLFNTLSFPCPHSRISSFFRSSPKSASSFGSALWHVSDTEAVESCAVRDGHHVPVVIVGGGSALAVISGVLRVVGDDL